MNQHISAYASRGFTLVESLITLALGSILIITAITTMTQLIASNRITTEINSLSAHLQLARSEAIKTGHRAVLCPSADGRRCLGSGEWHRGYMVFVDTDADRKPDPGETVVRMHQIDSNAVMVDAGRRKTVTYQSTGWAPGSNLTVTFCDPSGRTDPKAVVVSMTGRPRVATTHPSGRELSCG